MLLGELTTGSIDVGTTRVADGCLDADGGKGADKEVGSLGCRGLELGTLEVVELDEVDVGERPAREVTQSVELGGVVVHSPDEGVLVGGPTAGLLDVLLHDLVQAAKRVLADAGHEHVARGLHGGVERDGKGELLGLTGKATNHGHDSAG